VRLFAGILLALLESSEPSLHLGELRAARAVNTCCVFALIELPLALADEAAACRNGFAAPWELGAGAKKQHPGVAERRERPPGLGEWIKAAFYEDLSHREIAERTGLALGTVKSRMRLAFEKLRIRLESMR